MSDLVVNPKDRFSHGEAEVMLESMFVLAMKMQINCALTEEIKVRF